jgi:1,2-phenylacetyl-CoA epoxidase catalytic subunit
MKPARKFGVLTAATFALAAAIPLAVPATTHAQPPETSQFAAQKPPANREAVRNLFTPQEREQFRERMRNAKTQEERQAIRAEWRGLAEARAQEKGITLPSPAARAARGDGPYSQLFSEEERKEFREQMRAADSHEERQKLAQAHRAVAEERAKEKGITLPERKRHRRAPPANEPATPNVPTPAN